jgi:tetratricopeptide (TPR) repeat protein
MSVVCGWLRRADDPVEVSNMDSPTADRIHQLINEGDDFLNDDQFEKALEKYKLALSLIPDPVAAYPISTEVLSALGDAYFQAEDYQAALQPLQEAVYCPNGLGNPFIHLRLGQVQFQLGHLDLAADELTRAYMGDGETVFEDENPVYFDFLKTRIQTE